MQYEILNVVKVLIPATMSFVVGIAITPLLTHYLYKYKAWKKNPGKIALDGSEAQEFNRLHGHKEDDEQKTPRMGGVVIWASVLIVTLGVSLFSHLFPESFFVKLDFFSRTQTWIPLMTLLIGAFVGLINDFFDIQGIQKGLSLKYRLVMIIALSSFIGWWFWEKISITGVAIPFNGELTIGWLIIPFFVLVSLALYASGVIDGIDGLSGGVFASIFASYAIIAFTQQQIDLAAFAATVAGGILAFLWFNIPPARFYMTETGTMALTLTIAVLAFMTDALGEGIGIAVLPLVGALLVITVASNILQVLSKKIRGKKLFRIAPIHHHFEAIGWSGPKVVMRYWILTMMCAIVGVILALIA
jgi:phospho-N-acetylmuramoyl-pentapeptide-transferase